MKLLSLKTKANFNKTNSLKTTLENMSIFKKLSNFTKLIAIISLVFGFNMNQALAVTVANEVTNVDADANNERVDSIDVDNANGTVINTLVDADDDGNNEIDSRAIISNAGFTAIYERDTNDDGDFLDAGDYTNSLTVGANQAVTIDGGGTTIGTDIIGGTRTDRLLVTGDTQINDDLEVTGDLDVNGGANISIAGGGTLAVGTNQTVTIDGDAAATIGTDVTGGLRSDRLLVTGDTQINDDINVLGDYASALGNLTLEGGTADVQTLQVDANATVDGTTTLNGNTQIGNNPTGDTLTVDSISTFNGVTTVNNTLSVDSNGLTAGGNTLVVNNNSIVASAQNGGTITVDTIAAQTVNGRSTDYGTRIEEGLRVDNAAITGTLAIGGHTSANTLSTEGQATLNSLHVNTASRFVGNITADANYNSVNGNITLTNGTVRTKNLTTTGLATLDALQVNNDADITGNLGVVGNITSQQGSLNFENGDVNLTNGDINLTNGTINTQTLNVDGVTTLTGLLDANGGASISNTNADNIFTVGNDITVTIDGNAAATIGTDIDGGLRTDRLLVEGDVQINHDLEVAGDLEVKDGAIISKGTNQLTLGSNVDNTINGRTLTSGTDINGGLNVDGTFAASIDADGVNGGAINSISLGQSRNINVGGANVSVGTSVTGGLSSDNLAVTENARIGGTLHVEGNTQLDGTLTVAERITGNNGATIYNGFIANSEDDGGNSMVVDGTSSRMVSANQTNSVAVDNTSSRVVSGANALTVAATQQATIGTDSFDYGTKVDGGMLVNGDLGVNGNIYTLDNNANASIKVANNGLNVVGATNEVTLTSDTNNNIADGGAKVALTTETASVSLTNAAGNAHGIFINNNQTVISGGTTTGVLTLNDSGATFSDSNGAPIKVTGVANGTSTYDAVNYGQLTKGLNEVRSGISAVSAMANIPQVEPNKKFALGAGYGTFMNTQAFAVGGSARIDDSVIVKASFAQSTNAKPTFGVGVGYSW